MVKIDSVRCIYRVSGEFIGHYHQAAMLLEEADAAFPMKIGYNSPPQLSVEALEIYYRIHSNILKTLLNSEGRPLDPALALTLAKYLKLAANGLFAKGGKKPASSTEQAKDKEEDKGKRKSVKPDKSDKPEMDPVSSKSPPDQGMIFSIEPFSIVII